MQHQVDRKKENEIRRMLDQIDTGDVLDYEEYIKCVPGCVYGPRKIVIQTGTGKEIQGINCIDPITKKEWTNNESPDNLKGRYRTLKQAIQVAEILTKKYGQPFFALESDKTK